MQQRVNGFTTIGAARLALHAKEQSLNICLGAFQL
jgi:hypothetical protein